jgi:tRNA-specific 2-thiouridylase
VAGEPPADGFACGAKTRYRQADAPCTFSAAASAAASVAGDATGVGGDLFELNFDAAQWAVTPGQSAVLYDGDVCLGGGIIEHAVTGQPTARQPQKAALLTAR